MKENFNVTDWLQPKDTSCVTQSSGTKGSVPTGTDLVPRFSNDTDTVIGRIEANHTDITSSYYDWLKIGFAFANEHGEAGRDYFHRVSRFYPKYSTKECEEQYDDCMKPPIKRTNISTFFYLAQQAGIDIDCSDPLRRAAPLVKERPKVEKPTVASPAEIGSEDKPTGSEAMGADRMVFNTPQLPSDIYERLPEILRESCTLFEDGIEKDVFLLASLGVISGCLPNIEGTYFEEKYSPHFYVFITAPAGSGKGRMKWAKYFGQAIHDEMVEQSRKDRDDYEAELERYETLTKVQKQGADRPAEPRRKMFFIPGNSSSSAFIQALSENNYRGVLYETEADTLSVTFKQDWGNSSDLLRKAFHHESTSMFRRKDNEYIEMKDPHLAIVLSGTPNQVQHLMPDAENGLFSRFLYYAFEDSSEFKNPFVSFCKLDYTAFFYEKARSMHELYGQLKKLEQPICFKLTEEQGSNFTLRFNQMLGRNKVLMGGDLDANIKRLGLITFRIAMLLTALRLLDSTEQLPNSMVCSDLDFETAMNLVTTLEKHAIAVFQNLPNNSLKGIRQKFFEKLPQQFNRQGYLKVSRELGINDKTAEHYISLFIPKLLKHEHNDYTKITI